MPLAATVTAACSLGRGTELHACEAPGSECKRSREQYKPVRQLQRAALQCWHQCWHQCRESPAAAHWQAFSGSCTMEQPLAEQLAPIVGMGLTENAARRAFRALGEAFTTETAVEWIFECDDPNLNDPLSPRTATTAADESSEEGEACTATGNDNSAEPALPKVRGAHDASEQLDSDSEEEDPYDPYAYLMEEEDSDPALHNALLRGDWGAAGEALSASSADAAVQSTDWRAEEDFPLQIAVRKGAPPDLVDAIEAAHPLWVWCTDLRYALNEQLAQGSPGLLAKVLALVTPEACAQQSEDQGRLPLHWALCLQRTPLKLTRAIFAASANAATVRDNDGNFPLQLAMEDGEGADDNEELLKNQFRSHDGFEAKPCCRHPPDLMDDIEAAHPLEEWCVTLHEALRWKVAEGSPALLTKVLALVTPEACSQDPCEEYSLNDGDLALQKAVYYAAPWELVQAIEAAHPLTGWCTLLEALPLARGSPTLVAKVLPLVTPEACSQKASDGSYTMLPLHWAMQAPERIMAPNEARWSSQAPLKLTLAILAAFPGAAAVKDGFARGACQ